MKEAPLSTTPASLAKGPAASSACPSVVQSADSFTLPKRISEFPSPISPGASGPPAPGTPPRSSSPAHVHTSHNFSSSPRAPTPSLSRGRSVSFDQGTPAPTPSASFGSVPGWAKGSSYSDDSDGGEGIETLLYACSSWEGDVSSPPVDAPGGDAKKSDGTSPFGLAGTLYKRRNGLGRRADRCWIPRAFSLSESVLCYYDHQEVSGIDPSRPRGRINLGKEDTKVKMYRKKKVNRHDEPPSQSILTLQIGKGIKVKWDLCFPSGAEQMEIWRSALSKFDGPGDHDFMGETPRKKKKKKKQKGGNYNEERLLGRSAPVVHSLERKSALEKKKELPVAPPPGDATEENEQTPLLAPTLTTVASKSTKKMPGMPAIHKKKTVRLSTRENKTHASMVRAFTVRCLADERLKAPEVRFFMTFNAAVLLVKLGGADDTWIVIAFMNAALFAIIFWRQEGGFRGGAEAAATSTSLQRRGHPPLAKYSSQSSIISQQLSASGSYDDISSDDDEGAEEHDAPAHAPDEGEDDGPMAPGSTFSRCEARSGTGLLTILDTEAAAAGLPSDAPTSAAACASQAAVTACAVAAVPRTCALPLSDEETPLAGDGCAPSGHEYEASPHSYWNVNPADFKMRVGPNYKQHKSKAPVEGPALYDLLSADFMSTSGAVTNAGEMLDLPTAVPGVTAEPTGHSAVPPILVLTVSLPMPDGSTLVCVLSLAIAEETRAEIKDPESLERARPSTRLFVKWCEEAGTDFKMRSRFKAMAVVEDIESLGLGSFICNYNGKPVLISKSGTFTRHENYIEMSINIHMFSFIARQSLYRLIPKFKQMVLNMGFTIEARNDEELPELLLGGCRLVKFDSDEVVCV